MSEAYKKLIKTLQALFEMDKADLDFGIYRIMNQKRDEISRFLENDLLAQVREAFADFTDSSQAELKQALQAAIEQARKFGAPDPENTEAVREIKQKLASQVDITTVENEVFSHLHTFFSRYYDKGDFISQRRYKKDTYAIPYEGEEVKLYWANHDQYYIKSSEQLRDYAFAVQGSTSVAGAGSPGAATVNDGERNIRITNPQGADLDAQSAPEGSAPRMVRFNLVEADTEKDNVKAESGKERRFVLDADNPLSVENDELRIHFHYKPMAKKKQTKLNEEAVRTIFSQQGFDDWLKRLKTPAPTEKNPNRTLLEKHLNDYTARNTFDYFIHKDLGGFLRRELDFYIKNEVLHLDDIDDAAFEVTETHLRKIRVLRALAHKLIRMLSQLEDFQKRLWLKKKFVVETHYCMTLDRVPEELYGEIVANTSQLKEWVKLGFTTEETEITVEYLKENPFLVLDTRFFDEAFKDKLLASIENLDERCDGLLICSENFQALNTLSKKFKHRIKSILIDPPYNTGDDGFAYKDQYQHSSWIAMMADRLGTAVQLLRTEGVVFVNIDDNEFKHLWHMLSDVFGIDNYLGSMVWKRRSTSAMSSQPLSLDHEYILVFGRDSHSSLLYGLSKSEKDYPFMDEVTGLRYANTDLTIGMTREQRPNQFFPIKNPRTGKVFPPNPNRVWRFYPETMEKVISQNLVIWPDEAEGNLERPRYKTYFDPESMRAKPCSSWIETANANDREVKDDETEFELAILQSGMNSEGGRIVDRLFGERAFAYPKPLSLVGSLVRVATRNSDLVLDYFAGSGTTAHAVINLNREDNGNRKYILVEMGDYFDTVLKPRIQKVIYSKDWKDGKPKPDSKGDLNGISHCFKYLRLESYEDTLNNLILKPRTQQQTDLLEANPTLREDYMLGYWLDVETNHSPSLLNIQQFEDPFNYKLNIATGSAGATKPARVDLVETFNYLIGLTVKQIDRVRGFRVVTGTNPKDESVLVIWRNLKEMDNAALEAFMEKQAYHPRDTEFDHIYVNGDHTLEDPHSKVKMIEIEFKRLMFDVRDV